MNETAPKPKDEAPEEKKLDRFELAAAVLLGLAAIGGAWGAFQGDLWGGQSTEAYGQAATLTTKASTLFGLSVTQLSHDNTVDLQVKQVIYEALTTKDEENRQRLIDVAKYLYSKQLSPEAAAKLGIPEEYRAEPGKEVPEMPDEVLLEAASKELDDGDDYMNALMSEPSAMFEEADKTFDQGRGANESGDKFGLNGVLFTVCLFLAGIGLVFKSRVRWAFFGLGAATFTAATAHLFMIPWP